jgi:hypothetical protein
VRPAFDEPALGSLLDVLAWALTEPMPNFEAMASTQTETPTSPQRKSHSPDNEAQKHRLPEHPPKPEELKPGTLPEGNGGVPGPAAFPPHN